MFTITLYLQHAYDNWPADRWDMPKYNHTNGFTGD